MSTPQRILLLGEDHVTYGTSSCEALGRGRAAACLSAGARPPGPSAAAKHDPNEDGLLVLDDGVRCLLAVADAHFGRRASHVLLRRMAARWHAEVPAAAALTAAVRALAEPPAARQGASETTLLVAVLDRRSGLVSGLSFGDSTLVGIEAGGACRRHTEKGAAYVSPAHPASLDPQRAQQVAFELAPGGLLVAFTDGVDECHYGRPETSVGLPHLEALFSEVGPAPASFASRLTRLALEGVDGCPGGEDNVALAAAASSLDPREDPAQDGDAHRGEG